MWLFFPATCQKKKKAGENMLHATTDLATLRNTENLPIFPQLATERKFWLQDKLR